MVEIGGRYFNPALVAAVCPSGWESGSVIYANNTSFAVDESVSQVLALLESNARPRNKYPRAKFQDLLVMR